MIRFVQHFSLLCCFFLLFLLQDDHLNAQPPAFQAPDSPDQMKRLSAAAPAQAMEDILDIYGPVELPDPPPYRLYATLASLVLLLSLLIYFVHRRSSKNVAPPIDPETTARIELDQAETVRHQSGCTEYCQKVSDILRRYVEQRTGCRITRRTSSESLNDLQRNKYLSSSEIDTLKRCFSTCDTVKFGRFSPPPEEIETLGRLALELVSEKPAENAGVKSP